MRLLSKRKQMHQAHSLKWLDENGCEIGSTLDLIFQITNGHPCKKCNCGDTCPAIKKDEEDYQLLLPVIKAQERHKRDHPNGRETNAEMAKRMGITKRQAAKLRKGD